MLVFVFCMGLSSSFHPIGFFLALVWVLSVVTTNRFLLAAMPLFRLQVPRLSFGLFSDES